MSKPTWRDVRDALGIDPDASADEANRIKDEAVSRFRLWDPKAYPNPEAVLAFLQPRETHD